MAAIISLLAIFGGIILWAYFFFPPPYAEERPLRIFNWTVVGFCAMLILVLALNVRGLLTESAYEKYGAILTIGGAITIEIVVFTVFFVLRNFWIFKPSRPGGTRW